MRIEGDCVETWPQGMVMSGSGGARVEILRSAWILCDYLQRGMSRLTSRNVLTPPPHCLTAPCLEYHKLLPCTILHCIEIVGNERASLKPDCEPRLGGGSWRSIELKLIV